MSSTHLPSLKNSVPTPFALGFSREILQGHHFHFPKIKSAGIRISPINFGISHDLLLKTLLLFLLPCQRGAPESARVRGGSKKILSSYKRRLTCSRMLPKIWKHIASIWLRKSSITTRGTPSRTKYSKKARLCSKTERLRSRNPESNSLSTVSTSYLRRSIRLFRLSRRKSG